MTTDLLSEKVTLFLSSLGIPGNPIQKAAYNNLARLDFPTTKTEYWKYTRINKIQNSRFQVLKAQLKKADPSEIWATHYAVIENGMLRDDLSNYVNSGFEITSRKSDEVPVATLQNSSVDQGHLFSAKKTSPCTAQLAWLLASA